MKLDSVRALKRELYQTVVPIVRRAMTLALAHAPTGRRAGGQAPEGAAGAAVKHVALGIAPAGPKDFRLAVRVHDAAAAAGAQIERLRKAARGEVEVRFVGTIAKLAVPWHRARARPLLIGVSVGHRTVTAGTLGGFVRGKDNAMLLLSNNHVLAAENAGKRGDPILQPGPADGGKAADGVATLESFVRLVRSRPNFVDSATARLADGITAEPARLDGSNRLKGVRNAADRPAATLRKLGRTTGATRGRVTAFEIDELEVGYDIGNLRFDRQIEIEGVGSVAFSQAGDSGSLIVDDEDYAVAQLFAGSETGGANRKGLTYATPIASVLEELDVELVTA